MDKTVPAYRLALEFEIARWNGFRNALVSDEEKQAFVEIMDFCRVFASESSCATNPIIFEPMVMSILWGNKKEFAALNLSFRICSDKKTERAFMVKIQTRTVKKKYRDKVYSYTQHIVVLPLPVNEELAPFLDKQLYLEIKDDALILAIEKPMEEQ